MDDIISRSDRPLTLISVLNIVYFTLNILGGGGGSGGGRSGSSTVANGSSDSVGLSSSSSPTRRRSSSKTLGIAVGGESKKDESPLKKNITIREGRR